MRISNLIILLLFFALVFYPFVYIIRDNRLQKEQKVGWLIVVFFFSWLGLAVYLIKNKD
ncbi:PLDc N-terminal domain-containing protein [Acidimicrobiia bacterium]|nr:PLDc N-terminal domain-containing protein [Acidimicrobiia bacterium]